jgi:hypothetical protein
VNFAMGGIIGSLPSVIVTLTRSAPGSYSATGFYSADSTTDSEVLAIIAPASPRELEMLPEGERTKEVISVFTKEQLRTLVEGTGGTPADRITYNGKVWEVKQVNDYGSQAGYYFALATRL